MADRGIGWVAPDAISDNNNYNLFGILTRLHGITYNKIGLNWYEVKIPVILAVIAAELAWYSFTLHPNSRYLLQLPGNWPGFIANVYNSLGLSLTSFLRISQLLRVSFVISLSQPIKLGYVTEYI